MHLVLLCPLMQGQRNDLFLAVAVQEDLFPESHIPETCDDRTDVRKEGLFGNDHRTRHAQVVVGVRSVPDRLRNRTAHLQGHLLGHPAHEKRVLAQRLGRPMALRAAHGNDDEVVRLETFIDLGHVHGLQIDPIGAFHVTAGRRKLPISHCFLLSPLMFHSMEYSSMVYSYQTPCQEKLLKAKHERSFAGKRDEKNGLLHP
jgi:hypothetical protein